MDSRGHPGCTQNDRRGDRQLPRNHPLSACIQRGAGEELLSSFCVDCSVYEAGLDFVRGLRSRQKEKFQPLLTPKSKTRSALQVPARNIKQSTNTTTLQGSVSASSKEASAANKVRQQDPLCRTNDARITVKNAIARNAADRAYASMTAAGAGARSAWGRASAPTSASRAGARNAGDRRYASITAKGASARSAWGRASAPTSASSIDARTVAAVPRTDATGAHGGDLGPRPFRQQLYASAFSQLVFRAGIWGFRA